MLSTLILSLGKPFGVQGLGQLSGLTTLVLCCPEYKLEGVDQLSQLTILDLGYCRNLRLLPNLDLLPNLREVCVRGCCSLEDSTRPCENYEGIKYHTCTLHQCHQPFCNWYDCEVCVDRHRRYGVTCELQVHCSICNH